LWRRHARGNDPKRNQYNSAREASSRLEASIRPSKITQFPPEAAKQRIRKESQHNKRDSKCQDLL